MKENLLVDEVRKNIMDGTENELRKEEWKGIGNKRESNGYFPKKYSDELIKQIYYEFDTLHLKYKELANKFNIPYITIYQIINGFVRSGETKNFNRLRRKKKQEILNLEGEIWKQICEYEGLYEISNFGRIKSNDRMTTHGRLRNGKILKQWKDKENGYLIVPLRLNKKHKNFLINYLVARHFLENPNNFQNVTYLNGNILDNRVNNLKWCSNKEHMADLIRFGRKIYVKGENSPSAKLTENEVKEIWKLHYEYGISAENIANKFNISNGSIWDILCGDRWKHITSNLDNTYKILGKCNCIDLDDEIWVDVKGYEQIYQVSNKSRVRSMNRLIANQHKGKSFIKGILIKPALDRGEYQFVALSKEENKRPKHFSLHRLVALHFIPNPKNLPVVHHIDHNPSNNKIENLEWTTYRQNTRYAFKEIFNGNIKCNSNPKYNKEDMDDIKSLYFDLNWSYAKIAKIYNLSIGCISGIINEKTWNFI